jgi:transposase
VRRSRLVATHAKLGANAGGSARRAVPWESRTLTLFVNRRRDRLKILYWDRDGLAIWYKRLETGSFQLPTAAREAVSIEMTPTQLSLILSGIDLRSARQRKRYQRAMPEVENRPVHS